MIATHLLAIPLFLASILPLTAFAPASSWQSHILSGIERECTRFVSVNHQVNPPYRKSLPSILGGGQPLLQGRHGSTLLSMVAIPNALGAVRSLAVSSNIRRILLFLGATLTTLLASFTFSKRFYTPLLWPGTKTDPNSNAPLPDGSYGCPFLGVISPGGSRDDESYGTLNQIRKKLGNPKLFKLYFFGYPVISISGTDNIKQMLSHEFESDGFQTELMAKQNLGPLFGAENILYENDKRKHGMLRRLMGAAMTPPAIAAGIPAIQAAANQSMDRILNADGSIKMEEVANDFTLDIAWKQILGLDLKDEAEIGEFREQVHIWIQMAMNSLIYMVPFRLPGLMTMTKEGRARMYLEQKIEEKLEKLEDCGPDSSTISKMYFARDDDGKSGLTRSQLIDNALALIFAGSETSSSTLACISLLIALHPNVWDKIKSEQDQIRSKYGEAFTKESLEECTYLDAVIKETLRIQPVGTGEFRRVGKTAIIDGKQIPRNWYAVYNVKQTHMEDPITYLEDESHMSARKGFNPDRWLDESTKPSQWMPFGDGQRRCLGERLGMAEMKIFVATLVRRVEYDLVNELGPEDPVQWKSGVFMLRPLDGVEVRARAAA